MPEHPWAPHVRARLSTLDLDPARELEIVEELSEHLDQEYAEQRRRGHDETEARRRALDELLGPEALAAFMRPLRQAHALPPVQPGTPRGSLWRDLSQDLRYAVGALWRQPGFAAGAILTLALGIGANSAIFALVDATLLRPLPIPEPHRAVLLQERSPASDLGRVSPNNLLDWSARSRTFEAMGGFMPGVGGMVMAGTDGQAETIGRQWVTSGVFDALGVRPVAGRLFQAEDDRQRRNAVVFSESFWRTRYNADPTIIGQDLRLDGEPYLVVGVAPDSAQLMGRTDIWGLISIIGAPPRARGTRVFHVVGRLKPGVALAAAEQDVASIARALETEFPATNAGRA